MRDSDRIRTWVVELGKLQPPIRRRGHGCYGIIVANGRQRSLSRARSACAIELPRLRRFVAHRVAVFRGFPLFSVPRAPEVRKTAENGEYLARASRAYSHAYTRSRPRPLRAMESHTERKEPIGGVSCQPLGYYDWQLASSGRNLEAYMKFNTAKAGSVFADALRVTHQLRTMLPRIRVSSVSYAVSARTGTASFFVDASAASKFSEYLLDPNNRDVHGCLQVHGPTGAKGWGGYYEYDHMAVPLDAPVQAARTTMANGTVALEAILLGEHAIPGLWDLLSSLLRSLSCDPRMWKQYVKAFHGLILDSTMQTTFAWHEDTTTPPIGPHAITCNIQCSAEHETAFRILGFDPFYCAPYSCAVFPSRAIHQSIPWASPPPGRRAVKAVFFLKPPHPPEYNATLGPPPPNSSDNATLGPPPPNPSGDVAPPTTGPQIITCAHADDCALEFIYKRTIIEWRARNSEGHVATTDLAKPPYTSFADFKDDPTFCTNSALLSMWSRVSQRRSDVNVYIWRPEGSHEIHGMVHYKPVAGALDSIDVLGIAAFPGNGALMLEDFCVLQVREGVAWLSAPLDTCKVNARGWLELQGFRETAVSATGKRKLVRSQSPSDMSTVMSLRLMSRPNASCWDGWVSGNDEFDFQVNRGIWSDGTRARKQSHWHKPYLQPLYARAMARGATAPNPDCLQPTPTRFVHLAHRFPHLAHRGQENRGPTTLLVLAQRTGGRRFPFQRVGQWEEDAMHACDQGRGVRLLCRDARVVRRTQVPPSVP